MTCGGATQTRTRQCDWPDENNKGNHCQVDGSDSIQSRECGVTSCPGKHYLIGNAQNVILYPAGKLNIEYLIFLLKNCSGRVMGILGRLE